MTPNEERLVADVMRRFDWGRVADHARVAGIRWGRAKADDPQTLELYTPGLTDLKERALDVLCKAIESRSWVACGGFLALSDGRQVRLCFMLEDRFSGESDFESPSARRRGRLRRP